MNLRRPNLSLRFSFRGMGSVSASAARLALWKSASDLRRSCDCLERVCFIETTEFRTKLIPDKEVVLFCIPNASDKSFFRLGELEWLRVILQSVLTISMLWRSALP